jgi:MinD-like ATPase involved in chromosome partitioning or flagellar assembly
MSYVLGFYGIKDGQGVTTTALSIACELAQRHNVLYVDADMSGTGTAPDALHLDPAGRGMSNLIGSRAITAHDLLNQTISTHLRNLGLVPGLVAVCGSAVARLVAQFQDGRALTVPGVDFVIVDFGAIAHPEVRSLRQSAAAIASVSHRVFTIVRDDPPLLARAIQVLKAAIPPKTELLLTESRGGQLRKRVQETLRLRLPEMAIAAVIPWDPSKAQHALDAGRPMPLSGLVRQLQVAERAEPVLAQVRGAFPQGGTA